MSLKRVVVTGIGAITPLGNTKEAYWQGLVSGDSGAAAITRFDAEKYKTRFACEVKNYDTLDYFDRKEGRKLDLFSQYGIVSANEALKDSKLLEDDNVDRYKIGVIWGSGIGGIGTFHQEVKNYVQGSGIPRFNPFFVPKMIVDIVPGHISIIHGLKGLNFATVSACASATNALIDAYNYIRLGQATAIVSGGSEAAVTESGVGGFSALKALSQNNDDPASASKPFDATRDGFVLGEGGAALILEELEHANARGAKIYAEIIGFGLSADAHHITAPHPEGEGASNVMKYAMQDANIKPSEVDYINVHGTSTPLGDIAEVKAIKSIFAEDAYNLNISSTKSMTGHLLGGAGAIEAAACILAIEHNKVPPTINFKSEDENIDYKLNFTFNKVQEKDIKIALSNTFGFGGHNASIIFKEYSD